MTSSLRRLIRSILKEDWEQAAKEKRDAIFRQMFGGAEEEKPKALAGDDLMIKGVPDDDVSWMFDLSPSDPKVTNAILDI